MFNFYKKQFGFAGIAVIIFSLLILLGGGVYFFQKGKMSLKKTPLSPEEELRKAADEIVNALKEKNLDKVAQYVSSEKKLRFSPYSYVHSEDILLSVQEVKAAFSDSTSRHWGVYDGSGLPIDLTFSDYYKKFIFDKDFSKSSQVGVNKTIGQGNTLINIKEFYPGASFVEYHLPGTDQYGGMDWASLILVFGKEGNRWYLIGVVHNQWTI